MNGIGRGVALGLAAIALLALAVPAGAQTKLMIYTSVPTQDMTAVQKAFEAANPDIKLEVFRAGTGDIQTKIAAEAKQNAVVADLLWVAEPSYYETLKKQGLLAKISPKEAASLPALMKDRDGTYYAGRLINMIICYNTKAVKPAEAPRRWTALNEAKWNDKVVIPNPEYSGAMMASVGGLTQKYGWKYFEDMRRNKGTVVRGNTDVAQKVASGEFAVGMTLDYMVRGMRDKGSAIELIYPEDGTIAIPSPIAVMKASRNVAAATRFVDYILSREGQQTLVRLGSLVPVRADVDPPPATDKADAILGKAMSVDWGALERGIDEVKTKFQDIMM